MKVSFLSECVTSLRYFFPIIRVLKTLGHDIEVFYPIDNVVKGDTRPGIDQSGIPNKYNSSITNLQTFAKRINQICPDVLLTPAPSDKPPINTNILFTLECVPRGINGALFSYDKKFCVQHGTDYYRSFYHNYIDDKTTYITHDKCYQTDLVENFGIDAVCPDKPVAFWDIHKQLDLLSSSIFDLRSQKIAYIFYPDKGYRDLARELILYLSNLDLTVIVKQRRKHQAVESFNLENVHVVYDDIWYPSEAVIIPAMSELCIGFSSAAYTDLAPAGVNYIDLALETYSKCITETQQNAHWRGYVKPKSRDNFYYLNTSNFEDIQKNIDCILKNKVDSKFQKFENNSTIGEKFLKGIL